MGAVFVSGKENLLDFGAAIALPIAALGVFLGLRAWSTRLNKELPTTASNEVSLNDAAAHQDSQEG
jgi:hypothetical protein